MKEKVLLLGTLPPPIGGVTIHVKRLLSELEREQVEFSFFDIRSGRKKYYEAIAGIFSCQGVIIHYQLNNWKESAVFSLIAYLRRNRFYTTIHSFPIPYEQLPFIKKISIKVTANCVSYFVAPSETIKNGLISAGVTPDKIKVLSTFLPPAKEEMDVDIPDEILEFVGKSQSVILSNASRLYLNELQEDVYGLDLCIEACYQIKKTKFIFVCPHIEDKEYLQKCELKIKEYGIADRFLIYKKNVSLVALFKIANVFVRPTASDSYGISVGEALMAGVPAVASNVCERTQGTILYTKGNKDEFVEKILEALHSKVKCNVDLVNYIKELYGL